MKWVVDASVAAKWFAPEPDSEAAQRILGGQIHAPDLLFAEVANILWKKRRRGELADEVPEIAARMLLQIGVHASSSADLMFEATALAARLDHPAYDCFYLALAVRHGIVLVTADRRLIARCQQSDAVDLGRFVRPLTAFEH
ncbi:MAG: type II toxin-antitoxin system VapC family toxin [Rhodocyclaceae bacterium]|nr:type II toxin-antitoxin system VapC family toxin [Rhodocyclaceae bacterium]